MRTLITTLFLAALLISSPGHAESFLSKDDRRLVQRSLTQSGYNTRGVDGVFGKGTRRAIRDWQAFNGYRSTGRLTRAQYTTIVSAGGASARSRNGDKDAWAEARRVNDERAYRFYLEQYPRGIYVDQARDRLNGRRVAANHADRERALGLSRNQRREVEELLARAGYYPGSINGKFGPTARNAIRDYRRDRGIGAHAYLDREMLRYLVRDGGRQYSNRSYSRQNGEDNTDVAVGIAAGALLLGGIILLAD